MKILIGFGILAGLLAGLFILLVYLSYREVFYAVGGAGNPGN